MQCRSEDVVDNADDARRRVNKRIFDHVVVAQFINTWRFVKKQQMAWTLRGAHLLLQTRTKVLNNELEEVFRRWYPEFRPKAA